MIADAIAAALLPTEYEVSNVDPANKKITVYGTWNPAVGSAIAVTNGAGLGEAYTVVAVVALEGGVAKTRIIVTEALGAVAIASLMCAQIYAGAAAIKHACAVYGNGRAIFAGELPDDCALPAILVTDVAGTASGDRGHHAGDCTLDVQIIGNRTLQPNTLRALAQALWLLLDRFAISPHLAAGYACPGLIADPPRNTTADDQFPAFTVTVRAYVEHAV
jgi:hypothetical protein